MRWPALDDVRLGNLFGLALRDLGWRCASDFFSRKQPRTFTDSRAPLSSFGARASSFIRNCFILLLSFFEASSDL
jgi:hypothetical protein